MIRREFLQFFDLDFSLAVFDPETNIGRDVQYRERTKLCTALGLTELTDPEAPLLSEIMRLSKVQAASGNAIFIYHLHMYVNFKAETSTGSEILSLLRISEFFQFI